MKFVAECMNVLTNFVIGFFILTCIIDVVSIDAVSGQGRDYPAWLVIGVGVWYALTQIFCGANYSDMESKIEEYEKNKK